MAKIMLADVGEGMNIETVLWLTKQRLLPFKAKPGMFLALTLSDRTATIEGKIFENAEEIAKNLQNGQLVTVAGKISSYQGTRGLVLESVAPCDGAEVDMRDFMPTYGGDIEELYRRFENILASIRNDDLSRLLNAIFADPDLKAKYFIAPAAKAMHGAYLHGLLEHVVRQAELADAVCICYPRINRDLVVAGVLLHDIGKTVEFSWNMAIEYTKIGYLQGHTIIADRLLYERGREVGINEEIALQLSHLILSHHGQKEFGAVVLPQTVEAVVLHSIDNLEAKVTHCLSMLDNGDTSTPFTEYDRIEGRYWYRGNSAEEAEK